MEEKFLFLYLGERELRPTQCKCLAAECIGAPEQGWATESALAAAMELPGAGCCSFYLLNATVFFIHCNCPTMAGSDLARGLSSEGRRLGQQRNWQEEPQLPYILLH